MEVANARLILHEIGEPMIEKGTYTIKVRLPLDELKTGEIILENIISKFNATC